MPPAILLLQAREPDDPMKHQERQVFARRTGLPLERIVCWDLLEGPPGLGRLRSHDALMMGGSGDYFVSRGDLPRFPELLDFLAEVAEIGYPTFASCFGFQCLVRALGARVVHDPGSTEVGTYELRLTEDGRGDPVIGTLPCRFRAQLGRKDRAESLPAGALHLASSERCPYQAFRLAGRPIWATQFHPELSGEENKERFVRYLKTYEAALAPQEREHALDRFHESPETEAVLPRFLDVAVG